MEAPGLKLPELKFSWLLYGAAAGALIYVAYQVYTYGAPAASAAGKVIDAVNPANPNNVVNAGVTSLGQSISGDANWSLGTWLAGIFDPASRQAAAIAAAATAKPGAAATPPNGGPGGTGGAPGGPAPSVLYTPDAFLWMGGA